MFYSHTRTCDIERDRWHLMQHEMNVIARHGPSFPFVRDAEIGRLMHQHLYRIGHPLVRDPRGAGNG